MNDSQTAELNANVIKINELDPTVDLSWQYEGMDTEPFIYLYIGTTAKIRGTLVDVTALTAEMRESLECV